MVNEFRNHLTIFLAGTTDLFSTLPPSLAAQFADRLEDMESSAEFLQTLLTWMDASVTSGTQAIAEVGDLLRRAEALAASGLPSRVSVQLHPRAAGLRNRGTTIECALAALITEVGRVPDPRPLRDADVRDGLEIHVSVHSRPGALAIVIASDGRAPTPGGWRVALARTLLAKVGGGLEPLATGPGFEVRFRFK